MNARPSFPTDLTLSPAKGYIEINRALALIVSGLVPTAQASRLVLRAAALQAVAHCPAGEIATAMRAIADELDAMASQTTPQTVSAQ